MSNTGGAAAGGTTTASTGPAATAGPVAHSAASNGSGSGASSSGSRAGAGSDGGGGAGEGTRSQRTEDKFAVETTRKPPQPTTAARAQPVERAVARQQPSEPAKPQETQQQERQAAAAAQQQQQPTALPSNYKYHSWADHVRQDLVKYHLYDRIGVEKLTQFGLGRAADKLQSQAGFQVAIGARVNQHPEYARELRRVSPELFNVVASRSTADRVRSEIKVDGLYAAAVAKASPYAAGKAEARQETAAKQATPLAAQVATQAAVLREAKANTANQSRSRGR